MCLRFQPVVEEPLTFLDIKAGTKVLLLEYINDTQLSWVVFYKYIISPEQSVYVDVLIAITDSKSRDPGRNEDHDGQAPVEKAAMSRAHEATQILALG